jgi:hypothetical protein
LIPAFRSRPALTTSIGGIDAPWSSRKLRAELSSIDGAHSEGSPDVVEVERPVEDRVSPDKRAGFPHRRPEVPGYCADREPERAEPLGIDAKELSTTADERDRCRDVLRRLAIASRNSACAQLALGELGITEQETHLLRKHRRLRRCPIQPQFLADRLCMLEKPARLAGRAFHRAERGQREQSAETGRRGFADTGEETLNLTPHLADMRASEVHRLEVIGEREQLLPLISRPASMRERPGVLPRRFVVGILVPGSAPSRLRSSVASRNSRPLRGRSSAFSPSCAASS